MLIDQVPAFGQGKFALTSSLEAADALQPFGTLTGDAGGLSGGARNCFRQHPVAFAATADGSGLELLLAVATDLAVNGCQITCEFVGAIQTTGLQVLSDDFELFDGVFRPAGSGHDLGAIARLGYFRSGPTDEHRRLDGCGRATATGNGCEPRLLGPESWVLGSQHRGTGKHTFRFLKATCGDRSTRLAQPRLDLGAVGLGGWSLLAGFDGTYRAGT